MQTQLNYGNWIRKRILYILGTSALGAGLLDLLPLGLAYRAIMTVLFLVLFFSFLFPLYAYILFSQRGGRIQEKMYDLVAQKLNMHGKGKILDIGSGNGVLAVKLAQQYREADITGMDFWGEAWEYSKGVCDQNAQLAGVSDRVRFQKGDAARLDFADDTFDGVTRNLTFHEVKSATDARLVLQEALRVVKPGGKFSFVDYFYEEKHYGTKEKFEKFLAGSGFSHIEFQPIGEWIDIPMLLKHPRILGKVGSFTARNNPCSSMGRLSTSGFDSLLFWCYTYEQLSNYSYISHATQRIDLYRSGRPLQRPQRSEPPAHHFRSSRW